MDYQKELNRLVENEKQGIADYWKPEAGQHKVKALSELEESSPYEEEGKEPQLRKQIKLLVEGREMLWTMPYGLTQASTYGQLVNLALKKDNKLTNQEFTIVVTGIGKNKRFTIVN